LSSTLRKTLLVGASGQVGSHIRSLLPPEQVLAAGRTGRSNELQLDLAHLATAADAEQALAGPELAGHDLDAIYCIAGMTAVDLCEDQPALAQAINCTGPQRLAQAAASRGIPFVFFSTDYVFDGAAGPYTEGSPTSPLNVYGRSKRDGEQAVLAAHPGALVLRTAVVYGPDRPPSEGGKQNNYLYSVARNLTRGIRMKVPQDQVAAPTYNRDLARTAVGLMQRGASGIFHVCGPQVLGRLDFARTIAAEWALDASLLEGVLTSSFNQKANRPLNAPLLINKLQREYPDLPMRPPKEALADCREQVLAAVQP
jgi:dTDP-4-dehydrorhamnose reductase